MSHRVAWRALPSWHLGVPAMNDDEDDSLLREVAAAPPLPVAPELATFVLLEPGTIIDGTFRIESRLGAGGMGVVYAARDLKLDREVALKLMRLDRGPSEIGHKLPDVFEREARATARLNHPNIVTLHQFGNWNGLLYLVLERLRGETLHARMERSAVSLGEGVAIIESVARALVHTHAAGITHRDLKPQNVFLLVDGGVKVLDFGVSGLGRIAETPAGGVSSPLRSTLSLAGTPGYMAPEQWDGVLQDARTDIFAIGVMLYQLATSELPFGTKPVPVTGPPPSLEGKVPPAAADLVPLVASCLEPRRDKRLASASVLAERLHAIVGALVGVDSMSFRAVGRGSIATARVNQRGRRGRLLAISGAALASTAIVFGVVSSRTSSDECSATPRLSGVWGGETRASFGKRFGNSAASDAITRILDSYAGQWGPLREAACRTRDKNAQRCLDDRLTALGRFVREVDAKRPDHALATARALPALADCSDPDYLAGLAQPERPPVRDAAALVPYAFTVTGRGRDIVHGMTFVDGELVLAVTATTDGKLAGTPLETRADRDELSYVVRMGSDGKARWNIVLDRVRALGVTAARDAVVVAGARNVDATIGGVKLPALHNTTTNAADGVIAKLDAATGKVRWARVVGATTSSRVVAVDIDGDGNIYAAGDFSGRATFGGTAVFDAGARTQAATFVASWTADGAFRWALTARDISVSKTWALAAKGDAVVFASYVRGAGKLGDRSIADAGCLFGRIARDTGAIVWLHQEAGRDNRCITDAIALQGDRVALTGRRWLASNGAWVAELALADGSVRWMKPLGTEEHDVAKALGFGRDGTLYAAGHFTASTLTVGDKQLVSHGSWDGFVAAFDASGGGIGAASLGGAASDVVRTLAIGPRGELLVGGRFEGALRVGDRTLRGTSAGDGYVVEISPALLKRQQRPASSASP